jgi:hypothetical protein
MDDRDVKNLQFFAACFLLILSIMEGSLKRLEFRQSCLGLLQTLLIFLYMLDPHV